MFLAVSIRPKQISTVVATRSQTATLERGILDPDQGGRGMLSRIVSVAATLVLSACAITPSQDDVTGIKTSRIVRKIRCEARDALGHFLALYLSETPHDPIAREIGRKILANEASVHDVDLTRLAPRTRASIAKYANSAIAMNFSFDGTEQNDIGGTLNILKKFPTATRSVDNSAGFDRSRQNIQTFTVSDTFYHLVREVKDDYCIDKNTDPNYTYPISGHIGISKMLLDFVETAEYGNLGGTEKDPKGPPTMTFSLTFTTKFSGKSTPNAALSPVLFITRTSGTATLEISRTDIHKLTVGFSRPVESPSEVAALRLFAGQIINPSGGLAEQRAQLAIQQSIIRNELRPYNVILNQPLLPF